MSPICVSFSPAKSQREGAYLSSRRHWKWMDDSNKSTPVLSGSCLQSCMQCLSAASKSPAWYSRWANSANPWKESIRFVGSGESPKHLKGENKKLDDGNKRKTRQNKTMRKKKTYTTNGWKCLKLYETLQQVTVGNLRSYLYQSLTPSANNSKKCRL